MYVLTTFGGLALRSEDGTPLGAARRKPLAVLALLAVHAPAGLPRERVAALLWPDGGDGARHVLAQTLYALRRELAAAPVVGTATLALAPDVVRADVAAVRLALAHHDLAALDAAWGGPFLDGVHYPGCAEFERWGDRWRAHFAAERRGLLLGAARAAAERDGTAALALWDRLLDDAEPAEESVALEAAAQRARLGDASGAVRRLDEWAARVERELAVRPSAAVGALRASLNAMVRPRESAARPDPSPPAPAHDAALLPPTLGKQPGRRRPTISRRRRGVLGAAPVLLAVLTTFAASDGGDTKRAPGPAAPPRAVEAPGAARLAVMPFRVGGADPALGYLREGMLDLLAAPLDGDRADAAPPAVDARQVLRALGGAAPAETLGVDSLVRVGRRLGAGRIVVGSVVGRPARVVLHAALHDARTGARRAQASVAGPADSVAQLAGQLAARLLVEDADPARAGVAALTRAQPAALRAYLAGQAAFRAGDVSASLGHFQHALDVDSTFAYAGYALAISAVWLGDRAAAARGFGASWPRRAELTEGDRRYLVALAGPRYPSRSGYAERIAATEAALRVVPTRAELWYELGDRYFHVGRFLGVPGAEGRARDAFLRATALDPSYLPPREHLVMLHARLGEAEEARRALAAYLAVDSTSEMAAFLRWRVAAALPGGAASLPAAHRPPTLDAMPRVALRWIAEVAPYDGARLGAQARAEARQAVARYAATAATPDQRRDAALAAHADALNRGRPRDAARLDRALRAAGSARGHYLHLPVLGAIYAGGDAGAAARAAAAITAELRGDTAAVAAADDPLDPDHAARLPMQARCVLGQWRLWLGDRTAARAVTDTLARAARRTPAVAEEATGCRLLLAAGLAGPGSVPAADSLRAMMTAGANLRRMYPYVALALARAYVTLGEPARAADAAGRYLYFGRWPYHRAAQLSLDARLADARGDTARAACALAHYLALRDAPEPAAAEEVAVARRRLAALARDARLAAEPAAAARRLGCTRPDP